ncbi:glycoside hydrolase [Rickenella mellea]|uniref:chitinase n=1 Tax=Rickenella mellea TaxID=50990 RepID=A0A4Y7QPC0_9AGAM|nr:glycoside hydrolase [Rickenella mellea]
MSRNSQRIVSPIQWLLLYSNGVRSFDIDRSDNLAVYWGQGSSAKQQPLAKYCQDDVIDIIPISFLTTFSGTGGLPVIDISTQCSGSTFPGTGLLDCSTLAADIKACQSKGKILVLSMGGGDGSDAQVSFSSDSDAQKFGDILWNTFLGGTSKTRPFGDAVIDGIDFDIEHGNSPHYGALIKQLRSHMNGANKKYYITAAPQCAYPDKNIGPALNAGDFDAVFVQFYNNPECGIGTSVFNYDTWHKWATQMSPNRNVKVYLGLAASRSAAGSGYMDATALSKLLIQLQDYSSFGGAMMWDASEAYSNSRYDQQIKKILIPNGAGWDCGGNPDQVPLSASHTKSVA